MRIPQKKARKIIFRAFSSKIVLAALNIKPFLMRHPGNMAFYSSIAGIIANDICLKPF